MKTPREILRKQHRSIEPKLDRMWDEAIAPSLAVVHNCRDPKHHLTLRSLQTLWQNLVAPNRWTWAGLAFAWVLIVIVNFASSEPVSQVVAQSDPNRVEEAHAFVEQRQMLAQLIGPVSEPEPRKRTSPGPRSDREALIMDA
jgi:hypothetical protein